MKRIFFIPSILLLMVFVACDHVEQPNPIVATTNKKCQKVFKNGLVATKHRKVLVEDFTGHLCSNCPEIAYYVAKNQKQYSNQIVAVAIHPSTPTLSSLTAPYGSGDKYRTEWRIEEGGKLFDELFASSPVLPSVAINRDKGGKNYSNSFDSEIANHVNQNSADALIRIQGEIVSENNDTSICMLAEVTFPNNLSGNFHLVSYLLEDSIVDWQKLSGNAVSVFAECNATDCEGFIHRHVLRDVFDHVGINEGVTDVSGSIYGTELSVNGSITAGQIDTVSSSIDVINPKWNKKKLSVVAFVVNLDTKEVIQAEEVYVKYN